LLTLRKAARTISDLFIPPTFNLLGFILIAYKTEDLASNRITIILSSVIFGVILPILLFSIMRKRKLIYDNDAVIKEQRHVPYYAAIVLSLLGMISIYLFAYNSYAFFYWLTVGITTLGLTVINYFWKISAHAIGVAAFLALIWLLESTLFTYFLILLILIGVSRLILKVHTPMQILMGTIYGFFVTLFLMKIFIGN